MERHQRVCPLRERGTKRKIETEMRKDRVEKKKKGEKIKNAGYTPQKKKK